MTKPTRGEKTIARTKNRPTCHTGSNRRLTNGIAKVLSLNPKGYDIRITGNLDKGLIIRVKEKR